MGNIRYRYDTPVGGVRPVAMDYARYYGGGGPERDRFYNTLLTPEQERQYRQWVQTLPVNLRSDYDYDLRGAWLNGDLPDENYHMTDKWKKPWHATFSDESVYSTPEAVGGSWDGERFVPSYVNDIARRFKYRNWGANSFADGGIHIKKENRGKFSDAAKRAGYSIQAYARHIMANKGNYSPTLVKRANFARNAAKWHAYGGNLYDAGGPIKWLKEYVRRIVDREARNAPKYKDGTFGDAYSAAKRDGANTFYYKGDYYNTDEQVKNVSEPRREKFPDAYNYARIKGWPEFNYQGKTYTAEFMPVSERYRLATGNNWDSAKQYGFTDGSYESNQEFEKFLRRNESLAFEKQKLSNDELANWYAAYLDGAYRKKRLANARMIINPDHGFITLSNAGKNTGTVVSLDVLDRITDYAEKNNIPLEIAYGLPAQESAFGKGYYGSYDRTYNDRMVDNQVDLREFYSAWDYATSPARSYINTASNNGNWQEGWKSMMKEYNKAMESVDQDVLDWAYKYYMSGRYNANDPNHSAMVSARGRDFLNSPEIQEYLRNRRK